MRDGYGLNWTDSGERKEETNVRAHLGVEFGDNGSSDGELLGMMPGSEGKQSDIHISCLMACLADILIHISTHLQLSHPVIYKMEAQSEPSYHEEDHPQSLKEAESRACEKHFRGLHL